MWFSSRKQLKVVRSKVETYPLNIPLLPKSSHRKFSPSFELTFGEMDGGAAGGSQKDSTSSQCAVAGSGPSARAGFGKGFTQNPF